MSQAVETSPRMLARNAGFNAVGLILPLLLVVPILPYVLHHLGPERFAVLTLAWTTIGYFGFLDLGLSRAATRYVAALLGAGRGHEVSRVVWSSVALQTVLGVGGALSIIALSLPLARDLLHVTEPVLLQETQRTFVVIALGLPIVLVSGTMTGVLEAHQRFDLVNIVRVPANCSTLALPAVGVMFGWTLPGIIVGIVAARAVALLCVAGFAARVAEDLRPVRPHGPTLRHLLRFGSWITVSLVAGPILVYADRLLIAGLRSFTELAYYAVAFEIAVRTTLLAASAALTLFPAFSYAQRHDAQVAELVHRPVRLLFLLQWPLLVVLWLFPAEILTAWLDSGVAVAATPALRLLAVSFFINGFAHIALAGVQGLGRPDLKAKLDLVLVPVYLGMAALLIVPFGVTGAAGAKLIVTIVDTAVLFAFIRRLGARAREPLTRHAYRRSVLVAGAILILLGGAVLAPLTVRMVTAFLLIFVLGVVYWRYALQPADRAAVLGAFVRVRLKEAV